MQRSLQALISQDIFFVPRRVLHVIRVQFSASTQDRWTRITRKTRRRVWMNGPGDPFYVENLTASKRDCCPVLSLTHQGLIMRPLLADRYL